MVEVKSSIFFKFAKFEEFVLAPGHHVEALSRAAGRAYPSARTYILPISELYLD
jgi:hypothetical protein